MSWKTTCLLYENIKKRKFFNITRDILQRDMREQGDFSCAMRFIPVH